MPTALYKWSTVTNHREKKSMSLTCSRYEGPEHVIGRAVPLVVLPVSPDLHLFCPPCDHGDAEGWHFWHRRSNCIKVANPVNMLCEPTSPITPTTTSPTTATTSSPTTLTTTSPTTPTTSPTCGHPKDVCLHLHEEVVVGHSSVDIQHVQFLVHVLFHGFQDLKWNVGWLEVMGRMSNVGAGDSEGRVRVRAPVKATRFSHGPREGILENELWRTWPKTPLVREGATLGLITSMVTMVTSIAVMTFKNDICYVNNK